MRLWHRQKEESALWHGRFQTYLSLGPQRSVYAAYVATCRENEKTPKGSAPGAWNRVARDTDWNLRADAFDQYQQEVAAFALDEAMTQLRLAGPKAAKHLVNMLKSDSEEQSRLAANSILNRIGAVHTTHVVDDGRVPITMIEVVTPSPAKTEQRNGT